MNYEPLVSRFPYALLELIDLTEAVNWMSKFKNVFNTVFSHGGESSTDMLPEPESEILKVSSGNCPFCGESNACAVNASKGQPVLECWCFQRTFPKELLERVPLESRGCACVCAACLERFVVETK